MRGLFAGVGRIDNMMFVRDGKCFTRCWDRHGMYEIETQPEAIRPRMVSQLYSVGVDGSTFSDREKGKEGLFKAQEGHE